MALGVARAPDASPRSLSGRRGDGCHNSPCTHRPPPRQLHGPSILAKTRSCTVAPRSPPTTRRAKQTRNDEARTSYTSHDVVRISIRPPRALTSRNPAHILSGEMEDPGPGACMHALTSHGTRLLGLPAGRPGMRSRRRLVGFVSQSPTYCAVRIVSRLDRSRRSRVRAHGRFACYVVYVLVQGSWSGLQLASQDCTFILLLLL